MSASVARKPPEPAYTPDNCTEDSMRMLLRITVVVGILGVSSLVQAQGDPNVGTWKLNLAKSKYNAGQPPKSSTVVVAAAGAGLKVSSDTILADGSNRKISYTASYDGKDAPVMGTPDYDMVSITKSGSTLKGIRKKAGKQVQTFTTVVSADGKTRTTTSMGTNAAGQKVDNVQVYDKQ
jgi:hypothetical protein